MGMSKTETLKLNIDHQDLMRDLEVEKRAAQAAQDDKRIQGSNDFDENELHFIAHFRSELYRLKEWVNARFREQNDLRSKINIIQDEKKLGRAANEMHADIGDMMANYAEKLVSSRAQERRQLKNLNAFKYLNKLTQEPRFPKSKIFHYAVVFIIMVVEAALNTYIFAEGSDVGAIGGFWEACLVSVVNVGIAYLAGRFALTHTHHVDLKKRLWGWLGLIIYFVAMLAFNLMAAHYRVALEMTLENAIVAAFQSFRLAPFMIESFQAWMLLFLGLIASLVTLFKAYTEDDRYPGYGNAARDYYEAKDQYDQMKDKTLQAIREIREGHLKGIETSIQESAERLALFGRSIDQSVKSNDFYTSHFRSIQSAADGIIQTYREGIKTIAPDRVPAYFAEPFTFDADENGFELMDVQKLKGRSDLFEKALAEMNNKAEVIYSKIQDEGNHAIENARKLFEKIEKMADEQLKVDEDTLPSFFKREEGEAPDLFDSDDQ